MLSLVLMYKPWFLFLCLCNFIFHFMLLYYHVCTLCQINCIFSYILLLWPYQSVFSVFLWAVFLGILHIFKFKASLYEKNITKTFCFDKVSVIYGKIDTISTMTVLINIMHQFIYTVFYTCKF